nr:alpha/beta hydrolase-fold protein [Dyella sp. ASV24]
MRVHRKGVMACLLFGLMGLAATVHGADSTTPPPVKLALNAPAFAPEQINVTIYLPPGYAMSDARYPVLYANDGQDMDAVGLRDTLSTLYAQRAIRPVIVVAVDMLKDRASGYGLFDRARRRSVVGGSRIGPIGTRAYDYSAWVVNELVPYIDAHYRTQASAHGRTMLGWSLGALHAFCLGWEYPEVFGQVGAFSPSFWLAADRSDARAVESTRLAQAMVARSGVRKPVRFWFAVGGHEETNDRNHNGTIDAVEDLQDLITGFTLPDGTHQVGLRDLGYTVDMDYATRPERKDDVAYDLFPDGEHNQATWKRMLPVFLGWAYGTEATVQSQ